MWKRFEKYLNWIQDIMEYYHCQLFCEFHAHITRITSGQFTVTCIEVCIITATNAFGGISLRGLKGMQDCQIPRPILKASMQ